MHKNYMKPPKERLKENAKSKIREFRYNFAKKYIKENDVVLDAGCCSRYGEKHLPGKWIGVDYSFDAKPTILADLNNWKPDFEFDVFCGFESIEHIKNTDNYIDIAKKAKREIFISCPASETISYNKYHIYDFTPLQIKKLFEDDNWSLMSSQLKKVKRGYQQLNHFRRKI